MNKPPGHYKDEKGYEYYWDGQRRSYIPNDSFGRFMSNLDKVGSVFLLGYAGALMLPGLALVVLFILAAFSGLSGAGAFLLLVIVVAWVLLLVRSINYQEQRSSRGNSPRSGRVK